MKNFMARFTPQQYEALCTIADDLGISVAAAIRVAVTQMIEDAVLEAKCRN